MGSGSPCQCATTIGLETCKECGCDPEPWWTGIRISADSKGGVVEDYLSDNYRGGSSDFPASKEKLIQNLTSYGMQSGEADWVSQSLPQRSFKDVNEVAYALISHLPPISWNRAQPNEFIWRYENQSLAFGQQLRVEKDQKAILIGDKGRKVYDSLGSGNYGLSSENCPVLAANSRKGAPGFPKEIGILDGFPVFLYPSNEFEVELTTMGQTKTMRRISARGVARFRISDPAIFLEQIGSKGNYNSESSVAALKKYCEGILENEMSQHEFDELKGNSSLLENTLSKNAKSVGLESVKVTFSYIGEMGPAMFAQGGAMPPGFDPQKIAQLRQMAESMRARQMSSRGYQPTPAQITQSSQATIT
ncbi:MAG: hypothetical protein ACRECH_18400, partial [Nitrososphaerales archaeon]